MQAGSPVRMRSENVGGCDSNRERIPHGFDIHQIIVPQYRARGVLLVMKRALFNVFASPSRMLWRVVFVFGCMGCNRPDALPQTASDPCSCGSRDQLNIYRSNKRAGIERLSERQVVHEGDLIQLQYRTDEDYMAILSIDGRGIVTLHYPSRPDGSTKVIDKRGLRSLPFSFELDDAPDFEYFILVTSFEPIPVPELIDVIACNDRWKTLSLPANAKIATSLRLLKPSGCASGAHASTWRHRSDNGYSCDDAIVHPRGVQ